MYFNRLSLAISLKFLQGIDAKAWAPSDIVGRGAAQKKPHMRRKKVYHIEKTFSIFPGGGGELNRLLLSPPPPQIT